MRSVGIVALSVAAAVCYGLIHDQDHRASLSGVFHDRPPAGVPDDLPHALGHRLGHHRDLVGRLFAGCSLGDRRGAGSRPPRPIRSLFQPIVILLLVMSVCAASRGCAASCSPIKA